MRQDQEFCIGIYTEVSDDANNKEEEKILARKSKKVKYLISAIIRITNIGYHVLRVSHNYKRDLCKKIYRQNIINKYIVIMLVALFSPWNPRQQRLLSQLRREDISAESRYSGRIYSSPAKNCISTASAIRSILWVEYAVREESSLSGNSRGYRTKLLRFFEIQERERVHSLILVVDMNYLKVFPSDQKKTFGWWEYIIINTDKIWRS